MFQHVHHVHYLVRDLDAVVALLRKNFDLVPLPGSGSVSEEHIEQHSIKEAQFKVGETIIELTEPLEPDSMYGRRLTELGPHVMHVAWAVDSLDAISDTLTANGIAHRRKHSPRGYQTINLELQDSFDTRIQLAEG